MHGIDKSTQALLMKELPSQYIAHIITHADADSTFDSFSRLILTVGEDPLDDGVLMGYEIAELDLRSCDLVSLSACKTGLGSLVPGEGLLGLPRSFLGAGAKSVLMTLWSVDDRFAADLMPEFYHCFLRKKKSKVEALAYAKRMFLDKKEQNGHVYFQHPFFWAPFVLYGDPGENRCNSGMLIFSLIIAVIFLDLSIFARRYFHK